MSKIASYAVSQHQLKYMSAIQVCHPYGRSIVATDRNRQHYGNFDTVIMNSYLGFNTPRKLLKDKSKGKIITLSHSTFGSVENISQCIPFKDNEYFLLPEAWEQNNSIGINRKNILEYRGHFMAMYHYLNPAFASQIQGVLYLPVSGIKSIEEVERTIKNLDGHKVFIKPHPVSYFSEKYPEKIAESSKGIGIDEYKKLCERKKNVFILGPILTIEYCIDAFEYIIGTPPTSCLVEAAIRSKIYSMRKNIVCTNNFEGIPEKYGMSVCESPSIWDFGFIDKKILKQFVIGKIEQAREISNSIQKIIESTK